MWKYKPVLSGEQLLWTDGRRDSPFRLADTDHIRKCLIRPALDDQGLAQLHIGKAGAMLYRQFAMNKGIRLHSKCFAFAVF